MSDIAEKTRQQEKEVANAKVHTDPVTGNKYIISDELIRTKAFKQQSKLVKEFFIKRGTIAR